MKSREWNPRPISLPQVRKLETSIRQNGKEDASYPIVIVIDEADLDMSSVSQELKSCKTLRFSRTSSADTAVIPVIHLAGGQHRIQAAQTLRKEAQKTVEKWEGKLAAICDADGKLRTSLRQSEVDSRGIRDEAEQVVSRYSSWIAKIYSHGKRASNHH